MKKVVLLFLISIQFISCKSNKQTELKFVDEFVLEGLLNYKNSLVGGLSGVDVVNGVYYFVVDEAKNPRFLKAKIAFDKDTIKAINFTDVFFLNDSTQPFYKDNALDLESIFVDEKTLEINFVSEGHIIKGKKPLIFKTDSVGNFISEYKLPEVFNDLNNIKNNAVFEASSKSVDKQGFWVAMEGVLKTDGEEATFTETQSPIRITYFDKTTGKATKQYGYQLDKIDNPPKGDINLNGVTAILEYEKGRFFVVERAYQNGYGSFGNTIKIYDAWLGENTTNIVNVNALKNTDYQVLKKKVLFNFKSVENRLTDKVVDNIEGITFGPKLANGNQSLLLISDDNFQKYNKQLNQFILLEIVNN